MSLWMQISVLQKQYNFGILCKALKGKERKELSEFVCIQIYSDVQADKRCLGQSYYVALQLDDGDWEMMLCETSLNFAQDGIFPCPESEPINEQ